MNDKIIFSCVALAIVGAIQVIAFITGHNGAVFNFTALIIGAIVGGVLGISIKTKGSIKDCLHFERHEDH